MKLNMMSFLIILLPLLLAPLLLGVINRVKAIFAGRRGIPFLQFYFDVIKLFRKDYVYSKTTTWVFRLGPMITMSSLLLLLFVMPFYDIPPFLSFSGDVLIFVYFLGISRFFTIIAALDTGSSFEGMGASREAFFGTLSEPILMMVLMTLMILTKTLVFSGMVSGISFTLWKLYPISLFLTVISLFFVLLVELSRIPFDDPNTHLELTMIHEVMVLDHGGPDFGLILYAQTIKMWIFCSLIAQILLPEQSWYSLIPLIFVVGIVVGVVESIMARFKMNKVPRILLGAFILSCLSLILISV